MSNIDIQEIKEKLYLKVKPSGWGSVLVNFIMSSDFDKILNELISKVNQGKRFTPTIKNIFRAFEECPYDELKVVLISQDPYPGLNIADGIAFSCSIQNKVEKSLGIIYESIKRTTGIECTQTDLSCWSNQGMLLLNSSLTTTINLAGDHRYLWKDFIIYLLDHLNHKKENLIYVFMGKYAQEYEEYLSSDKNKKIMISHPASASYNNVIWDCKDVWNKINNYLEDEQRRKIKFD